MKVTVLRDPVFAIIIDDIFESDVADKIFKEAVALEDKFEDATIDPGGGKPGEVDDNVRRNKTAIYDNVYENKRELSPLITAIENLFKQKQITSIMASSPLPVGLFAQTNRHETQVSRYGNEEHYEYHVDALGGNDGRLITMVYYFHKNPKTFLGGELELTNSLIMDFKPIENTPSRTVSPKHNRLVIFSSYTSHRVLPTISNDAWDEGRFSANIWVGKV